MTTMIRKTIDSGETEEFAFDVKSCVFLVKNMSEGNIYVSFGSNPGTTDEMILIPPGSWQRAVCLNENGALRSCSSVYVKASGGHGDGVEVECLRW